ncbi:MAG: putative PEP-CTERM system TPR-repeat lipoprotein, partial [Gammaproteobacteria bacterium]
MSIHTDWIGRTCRRTAAIVILGLSTLLAACSDDSGKVTDHLTNARSYIERDKPRAAILELKSALQIDLENIPARLMLGRTYLNQGLGSAALKELSSAQRLGSQDADLSVDIAQSMVIAGEFDDALKAIETDGKDSVRWKTVAGFAHLGKQQHELARSAFERAIELDENDTKARRGLAQAAFASGDKDLAKRHIESALERDSQETQTWLLKGELELSLHDLPAAQASFEQVLTLSADSTSGRIGLVRALLAQKKVDESSEHLRALERLNLNNPRVNYLRALEARQKNDIKTAREALREVLSAVPDHPPSQLLMGQIMLLQRELDQAKTMLGRYVAQVPNNPSGRKLLAAVLLELDDAAGAVETLKPLEQAMPDDAQLLSLLGTAYLKLRDFDKGQMYMDRASKQAPEASAIRTQLAVSHLAKGDNETAATELQAVIDQNPDFERADFLLVLTQLRAGKLDAALSAAQDLVGKQAENAQAHNLLGAVFETRKDADAARAAYRRSVELAPDG